MKYITVLALSVCFWTLYICGAIAQSLYGDTKPELDQPNSWSGSQTFAGTTLPTQAAGTLGISGEASAPTLGANGEADIYITSTTGGLTLIGKGSANDLTLLNGAGSSVLLVPTGTVNANFQGPVAGTTLTGTSGLVAGTGSGTPTVQINGSSSGSNTGAYQQFQAAGTAKDYIGFASGVLGGAYSDDFIFYATDNFALYGGAAVKIDYGRTTASVLTLTANATLTGTLNANGLATSGTAAAAVCQVSGGGIVALSAGCGLGVLSGTTGSIGGSLMTAGSCVAGTATVSGAASSMVATTSPSSDPDSTLSTGVSFYAFVSSANTVTVRLCALVAVTPAASTYNVRVLP